MSRLATVERDALPEDERRFHDAVKAIRRRPITGPFIVLMNSSPDLAARFAQLGHYFHARGQADESILPLRVRAFIALIGSRALDGPYEWAAWVGWALEAGVRQDTVDAVREGRAPQNLSAGEALAADFCTHLISGNHRVSDATFTAALEHFGMQALVELAVTIGYFAMIALPLNAFEMEMSNAQKGTRKPFEPLAVRGEPWTAAVGERPALPSITGGSSPSARVPLLAAHEDLAPGDQHFLDRIVRTRGWIAGAFQVLLHAPDLAERVANIGAYILYETALTPAVRTLTALIAARELDCNYVWAANANAARTAGVDERLIGALEHGKALEGASAEQQVLFDFCRKLLRGNHHVDETTYRAAVEHFGVPATVQIAASVGYSVMLGFVVNAFNVPPVGDASKPAL